jgi:hypothetical protein
LAEAIHRPEWLSWYYVVVPHASDVVDARVPAAFNSTICGPRFTSPFRAKRKFFDPVLPIAKIAPPAAKFLMDGRNSRFGPTEIFPFLRFGTASWCVFARLVFGNRVVASPFLRSNET